MLRNRILILDRSVLFKLVIIIIIVAIASMPKSFLS